MILNELGLNLLSTRSFNNKLKECCTSYPKLTLQYSSEPLKGPKSRRLSRKLGSFWFSFILSPKNTASAHSAPLARNFFPETSHHLAAEIIFYQLEVNMYEILTSLISNLCHDHEFLAVLL